MGFVNIKNTTRTILIGLLFPIIFACSSDDDGVTEEIEPQTGYFPSELNYISDTGETGTYYFSYNDRNQITNVSLEAETVGFEVNFEYENNLTSKFSVNGDEFLLDYTSNGKISSFESDGTVRPVVYSESENTYSVDAYAIELDESNVLAAYNIGYTIQVKTNPDRDGAFKNLEFQPGLFFTSLAVSYMTDIYFYSPFEVNGYIISGAEVLFTNTYNEEGLPEVVTQKNASGDLLNQTTWNYVKREL